MPIDDGETAEVLRMCGIVRAASRSEDRELTEICQMLEAAAAGGRLPPPTAMVRYEELIRELYARKGKLAGSISRAGHRGFPGPRRCGPSPRPRRVRRPDPFPCPGIAMSSTWAVGPSHPRFAPVDGGRACDNSCCRSRTLAFGSGSSPTALTWAWAWT